MLLWTFRRNEQDVVNMYDYLADVMRLATDGDMLNFGYWKDADSTPLQAQEELCSMFGKLARLEPGQKVIDIGGGYGTPASMWNIAYDPIDITCVDINMRHLRGRAKDQRQKINLVNSTATALPFSADSTDRVLAFESAQHFRPLDKFISESYRVLKSGGMLALAIPVLKVRHIRMAKLGILSMTWSSEHHHIDTVLASLNSRFNIIERQEIGHMVYEPLADYYMANRNSIKQKISGRYPGYVEDVLFRSINKMKSVSQKGVIDYLVVLCQK